MAEVFYNHATEQATVSNVFSVVGTPTDPTTISLIVTDPDGVATTYTHAGGTVTKSGTGAYTKDVSCASTVSGIWTAVWVGTGTAADVVAVTWTTFDTNPKRYCSLEELKSRFGLDADDTTEDFELATAIDACSRWIDEHCDRHFWRAAATRTFVAEGPYECDIDDLVSVTALKTDSAGDGTFETTWSASDYRLSPHNVGYAETKPYTRIAAVGSVTFPYLCSRGARDDRVQVEGVFGWPSIPAAVKQACLIVSAETYKSKDTFRGQGGFGEFGPVVLQRNPQSLTLLAPYRKHPVLVA
jgi:hypothetical protein